ncbi:MAG: GntR family transcriptional regulator [Pseudohongiellaceae bacterium]
MSTALTVSHEIGVALRTEILRRQYRPGERLPSERDLAVRFNASRGAVREALSQLEQQGLIDILPGGVRVKPLESATLAVLGPLLGLDESPRPDLVDQFLEMFGILMGLTVKRALQLANAEQMIHLQGLLVKLSQHTNDFESMEPIWREMLEYLTAISDNLVVRLIGNDLKTQFLGQMLKLGIKPQLKASAAADLTRSLKQAFSKRDGELAAAAFQKHFEYVRQAVLDILKPQRSGEIPRARHA